jgi:hypothetical protein
MRSQRPLDPTIDSALESPVNFTPAIIEATKVYARAKPWRGDVGQRVEKLEAFHNALCAANEVKAELIVETDTLTDQPGASLSSLVRPSDREGIDYAIVIKGKLSVVTYLHLFALCMGYTPFDAMRFRVNLFKRCFPLSFAACERRGAFLIR